MMTRTRIHRLLFHPIVVQICPFWISRFLRDQRRLSIKTETLSLKEEILGQASQFCVQGAHIEEGVGCCYC